MADKNPQSPAPLPGAARKRRRSLFRAALGAAISTLCVVLLFRGVEFRELLSVLGQFPPIPAITALAVLYLTLPLRALQLLWLLGAPDGVGQPRLLAALAVGHLGNAVLPMRAGEAAKAVYLARHPAVGMARAIAAIVLSRVQDLLPMLAVAALAVVLLALGADALPLLQQTEALGLGSRETSTALLALAAAIAGGMGVLILFQVRRQALQKLAVAGAARFSPGLAARLERRLTQAAQWFGVVRRPWFFWGGQGLALACWCCFCLATVPLLMAFGLSPREALCAAPVITGLTTLTHLVPAAPSGLGTYHAACVGALALAVPQFNAAEALAFAVVLHAVGAYGMALPGLLVLPWVVGDSRRRTRRSGDSGPAE